MEPKRPGKYFVSIMTLHNVTHRFEVSPDSTFTELKNSIEATLGIPYSDQRLVFQGKILADADSLVDAKVEPNQTIHLIIKAPTSPEQTDHIFLENKSQLADASSISELSTPSQINQAPLENTMFDQIIQNIADTSGGRRNFSRNLAQQRTFGFLVHQNESLEILRQNLSTIECLIGMRASLQNGLDSFTEPLMIEKGLVHSMPQEIGLFLSNRSRKHQKGDCSKDFACKDFCDEEKNESKIHSDSSSNNTETKVIDFREQSDQNFASNIFFSEKKKFGLAEEYSSEEKYSSRISDFTTESSQIKYLDRPGPLTNITNFNCRQGPLVKKTTESAALKDQLFQPPLTNNQKPIDESAFNLAKRKFTVGQWVDTKDTIDKWLEAQVISVSGDEVKVHYNGWNDSWDEWISVSSQRIAPFRTHTVQSQESCYLSPAPSTPLDGKSNNLSPLHNSTKTTFEKSYQLIVEVLKMFEDLVLALENFDRMKRRLSVLNLENSNNQLLQNFQCGSHTLNESICQTRQSVCNPSECKVKWFNPCLHSTASRSLNKRNNFMSNSFDDESRESKHLEVMKSEVLKRGQQLAPILDRLGRLMVDLAPHLAMIGISALPNHSNSEIENLSTSALQEFPQVNPLGIFDRLLPKCDFKNNSPSELDTSLNCLFKYSSPVASTITRNDFFSRKPFFFQVPVMLNGGEILAIANSNPVQSSEGYVNLHIQATLRDNSPELKLNKSQTGDIENRSECLEEKDCNAFPKQKRI